MNNVLAGKTILVTGGTGSIGSEIVRQALEQGAGRVIVFSRDEIKHFMMRKETPDDRLETIVGDVRELRSIEQVFNKFDVDIIYHAAAMKHVVICEEFPLEAVKTNILGTQNVVDLGLKYNVPKMITISTDKTAYPVNVMGAAKLIAERITLNANKVSKGKQAFSCVRFGNVAISRGSVIPVYTANLLTHRPIQVSDPEVTRFIMEISDAVSLVMKATKYMQGGEIFIPKMKAFKLGELGDVIVNKIAPKLNLAKDGVKVNITGLVPGEKLHEHLINERDSSRIYELDNIYVVLPDSETYNKYPAMIKASLSGYASSDVQLISKDEIEEIVLKYLEGSRQS
ncbi:polysaccharide biosynthesis protein [Dehalococcoidia bacterium]|nr:polysaccharide biosynthesis protein [Dehalococcoidia bacterium]